jgi:hypothetical protein
MSKPLWRGNRKLWKVRPFSVIQATNGHTSTYHQRQVLGATKERVPAIDGPRLAGTPRRGERFGASYIRPNDRWQA